MFTSRERFSAGVYTYIGLHTCTSLEDIVRLYVFRCINSVSVFPLLSEATSVNDTVLLI